MIHIGIVNPKDVTNVGSVLRAIGCFQADGLFYTGTRYDRAMRYCTDTQRTAANVPVQNVEDILAVVPEDATLVCVELVVGATPLPEFEHPENAFYIFGPEDGSVPQAIVDAADSVVFVPTIGCMNLAASVNVLLYDRISKLGLPTGQPDQDDLIRSSRDNRNRLRLK